MADYMPHTPQHYVEMGRTIQILLDTIQVDSRQHFLSGRERSEFWYVVDPEIRSFLERYLDEIIPGRYSWDLSGGLVVTWS